MASDAEAKIPLDPHGGIESRYVAEEDQTDPHAHGDRPLSSRNAPIEASNQSSSIFGNQNSVTYERLQAEDSPRTSASFSDTPESDSPHIHHLSSDDHDGTQPLEKSATKIETKEDAESTPEVKYHIRARDELPDWRPKSLKRAVLIISLYVLCIAILYSILYGVGKSRRGYLAKKSPSVDWIFQFGPVFLVVILAEIVERAATDLGSIKPYINLAKYVPLRRRTWLERLTEPTMKGMVVSFFSFLWNLSWSAELHFASLFCALVVVPLQSALFSTGEKVNIDTPASFRVLNITTLASSVTDSVYPQLALKAIPEQGGVSSFEWVLELDPKSILDPLYAGSLPFTLENSQDEGKSTITTSAIYSILNCTEAQTITVTASSTSTSNKTRSATDVHIDIEDKDGCIMSHEWTNLTTERLPGLSNPLLADGTFALWRPIGSTNSSQGANETNCPSDRYHVISGPLAISSSNDYVATSSPDSSWVALSCHALYYSIPDGVQYDRDLYTVNVEANRTFDPSLLDANKAPIDENLLKNGLIYNMTFPNNAYFWGGPSQTGFQSDKFKSMTFRTCKDDSLPWENEKACRTYYNVAAMWSALSAVTAVSAAVLVSTDKWDIKPGTITTTSDGWYLSAWGLGYTLVIFIFFLTFLAAEGDIPRNIFGFLRRRPAKSKSGIHSTPSSIAGVASLFQDQTVRDLFEGVDGQTEKEAVKMISSRVKRGMLILRKWTVGPTSEDGRETSALVRPKEPLSEQKGAKHDAVLLEHTSSQYQKGIRHGMRPVVVWLYPLVFFVTTTIVAITFKYVVFGDQTTFQLWQQKTLKESGNSDKEWLKKYVHQVLFSALPTFAIALVALWWSWVDLYFRQTQPFVGLVKGDIGRRTILLDYIHDYHPVVLWKASRNHHWKLAYITFVTAAVKIGTVLTAGIFQMEDGPAHISETARFVQTWRQDLFQRNSTDAFAIAVRDQSLSKAVFMDEYPWIYAGVDFPDSTIGNGAYTLRNVAGAHASMTCVSVRTESKRNEHAGWTAVVQEDECEGATWTNACILPKLKAQSPTLPDGQCMAWKYLNQADCPNLKPEDLGRWWLYGLTGTLEESDGNSDQTFREDSQAVSMICTPEFWADEFTLYVDASGTHMLSDFAPSTLIEKDYWKDETGQDFASYVSELINSTMTSGLEVVTNAAYLDFVSVITALKFSGATRALFNGSRLGQAASDTFGTIFSIIASIDQSGGDHQTLILEPAGENTPPLEAYPQGEIARAQKVPLYIGLSIMLLICASIPFVWPDRSRRPPRDIRYPANVVSMIYDSSIMELVDKGKEPDGKFPELEERRFKLGVFRGLSGRLRMGIEVEEKVEEVGEVDRRGLRARVNWNRRRGTGLGDDER
ncbi:hypothetical protein BDV95DRAFT_252848 [Massariosphaeria phaeospora]|uniref:Uncharacterized protein n=1 Tax=Massariosphaeria phaeospora TaxID=100035 RepID=A0A7C8I2R8_9PLEO|nr:hypothetical protein BDV95DRAFT_252848 [Massariosphaeria phaeospora]